MDKSRFVSFVKFPREGGMGPTRLHPASQSSSRFVRFPKEGGM